MYMRCSVGAVLLAIDLSISAGFSVTGTKQSVIALIGDDVILPCSIITGKPQNVEVRWYKTKWDNLVYEHRAVQSGGDAVGPDYQGRTGLFPEHIAAGNVSLHLDSVLVSDAGNYTCLVSSLTEQRRVSMILEITVTGLQPWIDLVGVNGGEVNMVCKTQGWFPIPRIVWMDDSPKELKGTFETKLQELGGLWRVESKVTVAADQSHKFSCLITNPVLKSNLQITVRIARIFFNRTSPWFTAFCVFSALVFVAVIATILGVKRYQIRKRAEIEAESEVVEKLLNNDHIQSMLRAEARDNLLPYYVNITLDETTANPKLELSGDRKRMKTGKLERKVNLTKGRFTSRECVLGTVGCTSGRWYWEVEVDGNYQWVIGVASESADRKGFKALLPVNGFWTILRFGSRFEVNVTPFKVIRETIPKKVGILLDYDEGEVSFYRVDYFSLLHTFTLTDDITEPLYPLLYTWNQDNWLSIIPIDTTTQQGWPGLCSQPTLLLLV